MFVCVILMAYGLSTIVLHKEAAQNVTTEDNCANISYKTVGYYRGDSLFIPTHILLIADNGEKIEGGCIEVSFTEAQIKLYNEMRK